MLTHPVTLYWHRADQLCFVVPPSSWVPCKKRPLPFLNVFGMTRPRNRTHKSSWSVLGPPYRRLLQSAGATEDLFVTRELHQEPPPRIPSVRRVKRHHNLHGVNCRNQPWSQSQGMQVTNNCPFWHHKSNQRTGTPLELPEHPSSMSLTTGQPQLYAMSTQAWANTSRYRKKTLSSPIKITSVTLISLMWSLTWLVTEMGSLMLLHINTPAEPPRLHWPLHHPQASPNPVPGGSRSRCKPPWAPRILSVGAHGAPLKI